KCDPAIEETNFALGERYLDALETKLFNNCQVDLGAGRTKIADRHPRFHGNIDRGIAEGGHADGRGRIFEDTRISAKNVAHGGERLVEIGAISDSNREIELTDGAVIVEDFADDFAVWYHHAGTVRVEQCGRGKFD